jgi:hypothetical protein
MGMAGADQAGSASNPASNSSDWRRHLKTMRTLALFAEPACDPRRLGEALDRLKPTALQAAAFNPDHSEQSRAAIAGAIEGRGIVLEPWRMRVPGFLKAADLSGGGVFFGFGHVLRSGAGALLSLSLLAAPAIFLWGLLTPHAPANGPGSDNLETLNLAAGFPTLVAAALGAGGFFFCLWLGLSLFRLKPARLLVLREQGRGQGMVRKMLRTELWAYGHLIGLAQGAQNATSVKRAGSYVTLAMSLRQRVLLNLRAALAREEILAVSSSPPWRGLTASLLLDSADAIVIDISDPSQAAWKFDLARSIAPRCVFVSIWGKGEGAEAALAAQGLSNRCHCYAPDGHMVDRAKFRAAISSAMRASL